MDNDRHYLVLGMDPGIASCGFCLLDMTDHKILEMGSHLFDAPQEPKTKVSLATTRRNARSVRKNNLRTKARLKHCLELLQGSGLAPTDADKTWFQTVKGDKPILKLRAGGLNRLLTDREFAQVLYSLCNHRGYIPHGEGRLGETDDAEGKKVLGAIKVNSERMAEGNYQTVGEMLNALGKSRNKQGNYELCVLNKQIQDEAHRLFEIQRQRGNHKATEKLEKEYIECLTWEKKTAEHDARTYELVGNCSYFPIEKRAALADPSSEICRAYEKLKHLVIVNEDGSESRLPANLVKSYMAVLFSTTPIKTKSDPREVTYKKIRKDLDLDSTKVFKGIDEEKEKTTEVFSPKSWRCLRRNGVPKELLQRMLDNRQLGDSICEALTFASTEASLIEQLEPLSLTEEEYEAILGVPFTGKLFKGYGSRSRVALEMLIDAFEDENVHTLTEAEAASGLLEKRLTDSGMRTKLLPPYVAYDRTCRNPVVLRAMGRMRHIVNSIIKIHGVPDEIHIELGRDLKQSKNEKAKVFKRQAENKATNKRMADIAAGIRGCAPEEVPGKVIRKLAMREEQGEKDLYTGATIDLKRLVTEDHYCEIDHILPYSRTCDDSSSNKVLVLAKSNQDKRERTPYEWMTSGEASAPSWEEFQSRIMNKVHWFRKREKFLNTDLGPDAEAKFINRNLNDDRYMSVAVKNYLEDCLLFPEDGRKKHVSAVAGGATGNLRWVWGLNFGDGNTKDRTDDRHHAVDAAIIAACSDKTVRAVADASKLGRETFKHMRQSRLANTQPWPTFADEVIERRELVVPTRMADHGVTGRAFEDTLYHLEGITDDKGKYPLVRAGEKIVKKGNVRINPDGSAKLVDGMAFLRLWCDPNARPNGKVKGKWYAEPVYYADIPAIRAGTYVPRACMIHVARTNWEPIPKSVLRSKPIVLFFGDVLKVDGHIGRFAGLNIAGCRLTVLSLNNKMELSDWPSFGSLGRDTEICVIQEDCLGHCYDNIVLSVDDSTFSLRNA
ncbi:type II CRISPR RNA-guided endonuclease Cas9 [Paratractidigestivibacter sp.]|uniref:type II CRISPR RNA-guided endonuclease Cas9 n=1 Tax=Paratractidigestivibacter sp. TaxID=2847316 RepID=UPI002AC966CA|nr:type II CRISPR RNA-guided endonuclease Cas9 [Paratractidigestivibacter sp.]